MLVMQANNGPDRRKEGGIRSGSISHVDEVMRSGVNPDHPGSHFTRSITIC